MEKEKHTEKKKKTSSFKKTLMTTALGAALITGFSACSSDTSKGKDKELDKKETMMATQSQSQTDVATFQGEKTSGPNIEPDLDTQGRKVESTEEYDDKDGQHIIKKTYDDGSWSKEFHGGLDYYEYTEYYPNSNNVKFERANLGKGNGFQEGIYGIYDEKGRILYYDENILEEVDGIDLLNKYDEQGRLIYEAHGEGKYTYDDKNRHVTVVNNLSTNKGNEYKIVTVYAMTKNGEKDENKVISKVFVGETGKEIDLMNGGIDKLIKDRGLEEVPYIDYYQDLQGE